MHVFGFVVNPIAGMGGRVGLKGTDNVVEEAIERGAEPVSGERALRMLKVLVRARNECKRELPITWVTVSGNMGAALLEEAGFSSQEYTVLHECADITTREDTKKACREFQTHNAELIVFCGGDGTARDIFEVVDAETPVVGIPAGVKMHSGVFGVNPESVAEVILAFVEGNLGLSEVEIMDLDEIAYRKGEWRIDLHGIAVTPFEDSYIQSAKMMVRGPSEEELKKEIAEYLLELMEEDTLYILGSGSTLRTVGEELGIDKTLLGIDAVVNRTLIGKDVNEKELLRLLGEYDRSTLIVSPIGAQGFILGRGNQQLSPAVIKKIGIDRIMVVATPTKLQQTEALRVDTNDSDLDRAFSEKKYFRVITGYHTMAVRNVEVQVARRSLEKRGGIF
ncbi:MAG: ATP-NAD kinase family protein [Theionarchaea archaeon]|nr:ATP-NAD kinase family protein [Theionarchaea archaeon]